MNEDYESDPELYAIEIKADRTESAEDFIEFLELLQKEVLDEDEVDKRLQVEFFHILRRKLRYAHSSPDHDHQIEIPDQPDWNWLARLFLVGAFEN